MKRVNVGLIEEGSTEGQSHCEEPWAGGDRGRPRRVWWRRWSERRRRAVTGKVKLVTGDDTTPMWPHQHSHDHQSPANGQGEVSDEQLGMKHRHTSMCGRIQWKLLIIWTCTIVAMLVIRRNDLRWPSFPAMFKLASLHVMFDGVCQPPVDHPWYLSDRLWYLSDCLWYLSDRLWYLSDCLWYLSDRLWYLSDRLWYLSDRLWYLSDRLWYLSDRLWYLSDRLWYLSDAEALPEVLDARGGRLRATEAWRAVASGPRQLQHLTARRLSATQASPAMYSSA